MYLQKRASGSSLCNKFVWENTSIKTNMEECVINVQEEIPFMKIRKSLNNLVSKNALFLRHSVLRF